MTAAMSDWAQAMFAVPFGLEHAGMLNPFSSVLAPAS